MGLVVYSLDDMPEKHHRDYYIYLLDYGWSDSITKALKDNFARMATLASKQRNAVVIMSTDNGIHFTDEVLSYHSINGDDTEKEKLIPAILVTNRHPSEFKRRASGTEQNSIETNLKLVLFPLKKYCSSDTEVIELIQKIFSKIKSGDDIDNFSITTKKKKGVGEAFVDSVILEPNIMGFGFDIKKFFSESK